MLDRVSKSDLAQTRFKTNVLAQMYPRNHVLYDGKILRPDFSLNHVYYLPFIAYVPRTNFVQGRHVYIPGHQLQNEVVFAYDYVINKSFDRKKVVGVMPDRWHPLHLRMFRPGDLVKALVRIPPHSNGCRYGFLILSDSKAIPPFCVRHDEYLPLHESDDGCDIDVIPMPKFSCKPLDGWEPPHMPLTCPWQMFLTPQGHLWVSTYWARKRISVEGFLGFKHYWY